jgi:DNA-binding response OmpR family regulator
VLIVEPSRAIRKALVHVFERRGHSVVCVDSAEGAARQPYSFHCGVFGDRLPDASAISLAGWLLAEQRVRSIVFFGRSEDVEFRLRASNLGSFVPRADGLHRLERAVSELMTIRRVANGDLSVAGDDWLTDGSASGLRRKT